MAGSLNHIINDDGAFTMSTIDNLGDAHEALESCFDVIALLLSRHPLESHDELRSVCKLAKTPFPKMLPVFGKRADGE